MTVNYTGLQDYVTIEVFVDSKLYYRVNILPHSDVLNFFGVDFEDK